MMRRNAATPKLVAFFHRQKKPVFNCRKRQKFPTRQRRPDDPRRLAPSWASTGSVNVSTTRVSYIPRRRLSPSPDSGYRDRNLPAEMRDRCRGLRALGYGRYGSCVLRDQDGDLWRSQAGPCPWAQGWSGNHAPNAANFATVIHDDFFGHVKCPGGCFVFCCAVLLWDWPIHVLVSFYDLCFGTWLLLMVLTYVACATALCRFLSNKVIGHTNNGLEL